MYCTFAKSSGAEGSVTEVYEWCAVGVFTEII